MLLSVLALFGFIRRRLGRIVGAGLILSAAALGGVNLWAWHHFRAAEEALRKENNEEAQQHIAYCLCIWQRSPQTHLLAARIHREAGHSVEAEQHLGECIRLQHGVSEQTELEELLLRAQFGDIREIERGLWNCAQSGHAESARILETLARVYMAELRWGAAGKALDRWLELEPQAARAWHWRGWMWEKLQQSEKAIPDYEKAVALDPRRWGARLHLVRLLLRDNLTQSVHSHLEELMRSHGDDPDVQVAQAEMLMREGQDEEAIRLLDRLLQTFPRKTDALLLRGRLAGQQVPPHYREAEDFLRRCLIENSSDLAALHELHLCLEHQGKEKEAAAIKERYLRCDKDVQRLLRLTKEDVARAPYDPNVLAEIGELSLKLGEEDSGVKWLERALRCNPNHQRSHKVLIDYYQSKGETAEAEKHRAFLGRPFGPSFSSNGN